MRSLLFAYCYCLLLVGKLILRSMIAVAGKSVVGGANGEIEFRVPCPCRA